MNVPFEYQLWSAKECAEYHKRSVDYFLRKIRHTKGYPKPVNESGHPVWRAIDVAKFVSGYA